MFELVWSRIGVKLIEAIIPRAKFVDFELQGAKRNRRAGEGVKRTAGVQNFSRDDGISRVPGRYCMNEVAR